MLEARAFEPDFQRQLDRLALAIRRARTTRAGQRTIGRVQGMGMELENFKSYAEGDDLRQLDWNALARLDQLRIRTYRATRQAEVTALVDASASMGAPRDDDKLGLALLLGAALAYVAIGEHDPARIVTFSTHRGATHLVRSRFHYRHETFHELQPLLTTVRPRGPTRFAPMATELVLERRPRGIMVLISDFLVPRAEYEDALAQLTAAGQQVKVVHVMGARECAGEYPLGRVRMRDAETGEVREIALDEQVAVRYRERVEQRAAELRDFCTRKAVAYVRAFGAANYERIIADEFPRLGLIV